MRRASWEGCVPLRIETDDPPHGKVVGLVRKRNQSRPLAPLPLTGDAAVDLHLHTLASDGFWTPAALIDFLREGGFAVASVCDHDTQRSVVDAIELGEKAGIRVIPGVEVTCRWEDRQLHVLVHGIDPRREDDAAQPFLLLLQEIDIALQKNAWDAKRRFEESGRALPSLEEIRAGRPLWPFHVLSAAIKDGHAKNLKESAELLVSLGGTFTADLPVAEVVEAAHRAGGICTIAHPGRADAVGVVTDVDLDRMRESVPVDGLEAHYRSYTDAQTALYREMAVERSMLISCGSDSHAPKMPVDPRPWKAAWCAELLGRLGIPVDPDTITDPVWSAGMDPDAVVPTLEGEETPPQIEPAEEVLMDVEAELEAAQRIEEEQG